MKKATSLSRKTSTKVPYNNKRFTKAAIKRDLKVHWPLYLMGLPVLAFYLIFNYKPMGGLLIAFQDYSPRLGISGSPFVGIKHFVEFLTNPYFWRLIKNTFTISISNLIFGFPAPILLALLMNEIRTKWFKRGVQLVVYLPHFISLIVVCGLVAKFTQDNGIINDFLALFGKERISYLNYPQYFVPIYVISQIWSTIGWSSIIYLAALTGVDEQLYEAAIIDGAGRWKQTIHVTLPGITSTIVVMLILAIGNLLSVGYEKIILLYNPITYETADVISTYVYRKGLLEGSWSFSTAVGLFNSILNFVFLISANKLSKKMGEQGLW